MKLLNGVLSTCAVALAFSTSAALAAGSGEAGGQESQKKSDVVSKLDKTATFNQLHHINQKYVEMAQLAIDKSQSQQLKDAAKKIQQEHRSAVQDIQNKAKSENIELGGFQLSTYEKVVMDQLKDLDQNQFDQAFLSALERSHQMSKQDLQALSDMTTDPELKQMVQNMIPRVDEHRQLVANIQPMQREIGGEQKDSMQQEQGAEQQQQSESQQ